MNITDDEDASLNKTDVQAAYWQGRFDHTENPPPELYEQFQQWLNADPKHVAAYQSLQAAVDLLVTVGVESGRRKPPPTPS